MQLNLSGPEDLSLVEDEPKEDEGVDPRDDNRGMEAANDDESESGPDDLKSEDEANRALDEGQKEAA